MSRPLLVSYAGCGTCRSAARWLASRSIDVELRPLLDEPPTRPELVRWVGASKRPLRKWLNTSGQSYRALGKALIDTLDDEALLDRLAADPKLVKRPILVHEGNVLVGFDEAAYSALFAR